MRKTWAFLALAILAGNYCTAAIEKVDATEKKAWINHVLPLPHEISIGEKAALFPKDIKVTLATDGDDIAANAVAELKAFLKDKTGVEPTGSDFEIVVGTLDKDGKLAGISPKNATRLGACPNKDQAYLIEPVGGDKLLVAGLNGKGVYYGTVTLRQLLGAFGDKDKIVVPLAEIVDWPDMAERGLWNGGKFIIPFMAAMKLNFTQEYHPDLSVRRTPAGPVVTVKFDKAQWNAARRKAFNLVPEITHMNFLQYYFKIYDVYPELQGKGKAAAQRTNKTDYDYVCPCASNPLLVDILAKWMEGFAEKGVMDMTVWTSEFFGQCGCDKCARTNQFVLETRAIVNAWKRVHAKYPDFLIRVFLGFDARPELMSAVLAEIPAELKIERACYSSSEKLFDRRAEAGDWLASYRLPFVGTCFDFNVLAQQRAIKRLYDRKWSGAYSLLRTVDVAYNETFAACEIGAIAEWGWNVNGRDARDFAIAWATRQGDASPEKFGEWAAIMGPIEADIDETAPAFLQPGWVKERVFMLSAGERRGHLSGKPGFFRFCPAEPWIRQCEKALELAKTFKSRDWEIDTEWSVAFLMADEATNNLLEATKERDAEKKRAMVKDGLAMLKSAAARFSKATDAKIGLFTPDMKRHRAILSDYKRNATDYLAAVEKLFASSAER